MNSWLEAFLTEMTGVKGERPPPDVAPYALRLYERRTEGIIVPGGRLVDSNWQPALNDCHANVNALCEADPRSSTSHLMTSSVASCDLDSHSRRSPHGP